MTKKCAILWDNASAHRARSVRACLERLDIMAIFNIPYHPQYNGIEHVFADVRARFRKRLTALKISGADEIDLEAIVTATFTETDRRIATN